ncbi:hypothetical protein Holit_01893 [Hollandina sp. SP2]
MSVAGQTYLIEEQTSDDANMAIRVFEYNYAQGLKEKTIHAGTIILSFSRAAVIYLEESKVMPEQWEIQVVFPLDILHSFKIPTAKMLEYSYRRYRGTGTFGLVALL